MANRRGGALLTAIHANVIESLWFLLLLS